MHSEVKHPLGNICFQGINLKVSLGRRNTMISVFTFDEHKGIIGVVLERFLHRKAVIKQKMIL